MADRTPRPLNGTLAIVLGYALFAALWIVLSDRAVAWLVHDPAHIVLAGTLKGGMFVLVTATLLYLALHRRDGSTAAGSPAADLPGGSRLPFLLLIIATLALTASAVGYGFQQERAKETARLQAIAGLRASMVRDWLRERLDDAAYVRDDPNFSAAYRRWRRTGSATDLAAAASQLKQWALGQGFDGVSLLDAAGRPVWRGDGEHAALPSPPGPAAQAGNGPALVEPYRDAGGRMHLDFVMPVPIGQGDRSAVVFHADPEAWLLPTLRGWPVPSETAETLLFRRDGNHVLFVSDLRHRRDAAMQLRLSVTTPSLLAAQVVRGEVRWGQLFQGTDYRGVAVLGVAQPIPGAGLFLIAKIDRAELYGEAARQTAWIGLVGLLALAMVLAGYRMMRQAQRLAVSEGVRAAQAEALRGLRLLDAIAESSDDAIYAEDVEGRYILFNRAACANVGRPLTEVLGRDARALFPPDQAERLLAMSRRALAAEHPFTEEMAVDTAAGQRAFLITKGPLRDDAGRVIGCFGMARDISAQKAIEAALRKTEATYRSLFENLMNSVTHVRMIFAGDRAVDMEYLAVNPAFAAVTGITGPVVGRRISEVIPGYCEHNADSLARFGQVAATGEPARWDHYLAELDRWFAFMAYTPAPGEVVIVGENITERKRAEAALTESEKTYRSLFENMMNGYAYCRMLFEDGEPADFVYLAVNRAFGAQTGLREVVGRSVSEVIPGIRQRDPQLFEAYGRVARGGAPERFEIRVEALDMWFDITVYSPRPEHFVAVFDVITARKAAEAALRASERRFHDIVAATADWVWEVDAEGRYTYASDGVRDLLGYSAEEIVGRTPFDLMPPAEAERVAPLFTELVARREPFRDLDNVNRHKDGSLHYVQTNGTPILDEGGRLLGYRGLDRDVTRQKEAERALLEARNRLHALLDTLPDLVWLKDADGVYLSCNQRFEAFFGAREADIAGRTDYDFLPRELADLFRARDRDAMAAGGPTVNEEEVTFASDGHHEWLQTIKTPFRGADGCLVGVLGIARDISAVKAAEADLRQRNAELERFNQATVGRELDIIELKKEINALSIRLGLAPPYALDFLNEPETSGPAS